MHMMQRIYKINYKFLYDHTYLFSIERIYHRESIKSVLSYRHILLLCNTNLCDSYNN